MYSERNELISQLMKNLPEVRKKLGLSQTELGELIGVSRQTISSIERGETPLSWGNYLAILFLISNLDPGLREVFPEIFDGIDGILQQDIRAK